MTLEPLLVRFLIFMNQYWLLKCNKFLWIFNNQFKFLVNIVIENDVRVKALETILIIMQSRRNICNIYIKVERTFALADVLQYWPL